MKLKTALNSLKWVYKVVRSIILTAIIAVTAIIVFLYIALSIPPVQNNIRTRAETELSNFLESKVEIGELDIRPMNELIIGKVKIYDLNGEECLYIDRLGAGINLWRLLLSGKIEITHVELLDFKTNIYQVKDQGPFNIDFILKAFAPKDKSKPPTKFDLRIHNIVLRGGTVKFDRLWKERKTDGTFDSNHILVNNLCSDITIPRLSNEHSEIDLRRLSFSEISGLQVKEIGGLFTLTNKYLGVADLTVRLPETAIKADEFRIPFTLFENKNEGSDKLIVKIRDSRIAPSNFAAFYHPLQNLDVSLPLEMDLEMAPNYIDVQNLNIGGATSHLDLKLNMLATNLRDKEKLEVDLKNIELQLQPSGGEIIERFIAETNQGNTSIGKILRNLGTLTLEGQGHYNYSDNLLAFSTDLSAAPGQVSAEGGLIVKDNTIKGDIEINIPSFDFSNVIEGLPIGLLKEANFKIAGTANTRKPLLSEGHVEIAVSEINLLGRRINSILGEGTKSGDLCSLSIEIDDNNLNGNVEASVELAGEATTWDLTANINDFDTYSSFIDETVGSGYELKGVINANAIGNNIDNMVGKLEMKDVSVKKWNGKSIDISYLELTIDKNDYEKRVILSSGIADFVLTGDYTLSLIPGMVRKTMGEIMPAIFPIYDGLSDCGEGEFTLSIKNAQSVIDFFNLPIFPLTEMEIEGRFDSNGDIITFSSEIPYIQQGENKLITDTYLNFEVKGQEGELKALLGTVYPTKKGLLKLDIDISGKNGLYDVLIDFNEGRNVSFYGDVRLQVSLEKDIFTNGLVLTTDFDSSSLYLNETEWKMEESQIVYTKDYLKIEGFCVRHDDQFVTIDGHNDMYGEGEIIVTLSDINMDYIFDTLNINHVTFGGEATGVVRAKDIFGQDPQVQTETLYATNFSYNGALLGEADLRAKLSLSEKKISIGALITENNRNVVKADGGVWFGRDSLAFNFKADSVNIGFMQPFMQAFSSDVRGRASGDATLYGTFSDIDMVGTIIAKDADIKIDYINARYTGSDTVYMTPGKIDIPHIEVKDKYGHTATVAGELKHRYFHEPEFNFRVTDMHDLLVYDTNAKINPLWYGLIFVSGNGEIIGRPGLVRIAADVETRPGSDFTFVLSDQQEAVKSHFLTFSDRRREARETLMAKNTVPDFLEQFRKKNSPAEESSDVFIMDFRVSVTDDIRLNLIMDPTAGDKIVAYGTGAMNMTYSSLTDELKLYGKYILDKGTYNFSLQDIILKEFTIKPGSSIAFTGNPYTGILDITAAYKVNTSLTELDQSFANDRELNRTSVPVEALLKVSGVLTNPTIGFDIELPTVTEETAQKVKSIISTEDMMSRQVLYLIALNKFYPPEYMATSNTGGEWASIASSTISSQIQNMIGQITDKFTLSPSIRSDKGDFSDIEVDLAINSQLFNDRLLINGNLGYRDPSNSSTMFVGDFDLEYLLNRKGTWRLKAYNHFNDQNYYLKSALTTQGIGIVWRKDFGIPRKKEEPRKEEDIQDINEQDNKVVEQ